MPANIIIADTQELTIAGLRYLLTDTDIHIMAEVKKIDQLWLLLSKHVPDVLIFDHLQLKGFQVEHLLRLHQTYSTLSLMVISADETKETITSLLEAGVNVYLTKNCSREEILMAIRASLKGEKFFCHRVLDILIGDRVKKGNAEDNLSGITEREIQIIRFIARGNSTQYIANELNLSPHTIHSHRKNIHKKLKIKSPAELIIYAIDHGLIDIDK